MCFPMEDQVDLRNQRNRILMTLHCSIGSVVWLKNVRYDDTYDKVENDILRSQ